METYELQNWNKVIYCVSEVYCATNLYKSAEADRICSKIRKNVVSLSVSVNKLSLQGIRYNYSRLYPVLSTVYVVKAYLQLAKKFGFIDEVDELDGKLSDIRDNLLEIIGLEKKKLENMMEQEVYETSTSL